MEEDWFVLARFAADRDVILDFEAGTDRLAVDAAAFGGGLVQGNSMLDTQFVLNGPATTTLGTFLYNTTTGVLRYDVDGTGGRGATHVATLTGAPVLDVESFILI